MVGTSQPTISRIERATAEADLTLLAMIGTVIGLDLVVAVYPGGAPVRDAGHIKLTYRLQGLLPTEFVWQTEQVMPAPGDQRSIDAIIRNPPLRTGFELESRLVDGQAVARRALLKQRDANLACMILVFADTTANRRAVASSEATLRPAFPLGARQLLFALRSHRTPPANGILFA
ncbi:MAG: hypothetical protein LC744_07935 [Chloroflexi bacterium]|nr:hypothetical protein [Chloroflexota bacterium]